MEIKIQPVTIFPDVAKKLKLDLVQVKRLGTEGEAIVAWSLLTEEDERYGSGRVIKNGIVTLTGWEYNEWGSDDDYVLNLIVQKLGLTPAT